MEKEQLEKQCEENKKLKAKIKKCLYVMEKIMHDLKARRKNQIFDATIDRYMAGQEEIIKLVKDMLR